MPRAVWRTRPKWCRHLEGRGNYDRDIPTQKAISFWWQISFLPPGFHYPNLEVGVNKESQFAT
jgi:hypothetical protein